MGPDSGMTTKIIYFMVNGSLERAEFGADCSAADVKGESVLPGYFFYTTVIYIDILLKLDLK